MGGADTGRSNADEEANPPRSCAKGTPTTSIKGNLVVRTTQGRCPQHCQVSGPPPRHPAAPPRHADRQHHLPGPPSRLATARTRATTPHDSATRSPSCTELTARRPRLPHQHPRPSPRPKSQTASTGTRQPGRHSRRPSDSRMSPKLSQATTTPHEAAASHGSRGCRLDAQVSSARGRCPDIHQPDNNRST
jgi:hypothetical protein